MKILMIVGSMRKESFNMQLAREAEKLLEGKAEVSFLSYGDIPYMNQDIEYPAPESIARVRAEAQSADGLWIFTPEYNHSFPGVLKNLLDWLSRPLVEGNRAAGTAVSGKKAAISGAAGKSAAAFARAQLRELLGFMGVSVLEEETGATLGAEAFMSGKLSLSGEELSRLRKQAEAFTDLLS
ncbi:MAG: NAD(P)H-dependent oxidoreductase [Oscillospiraceae bacterium]|nr:NAD(P)H-dependent oxidoreductase [Oscillospiraceae bacterium]